MVPHPWRSTAAPTPPPTSRPVGGSDLHPPCPAPTNQLEARRGAPYLSARAAATPNRQPVTSPDAQQGFLDNLLAALADVPRGNRVQQGFDKTQIKDQAYLEAYLAGLQAEAAAVQPALTQLARHVAEQLGGVAGGRTQPKDDRRAMDKIRGDDGDASRLVDLAGAKVEFGTVAQVYQALEYLVEHLGQVPGLDLVRLKDRLAGKPRDSGYGDLLLNLRMPNGHVGELRLQLEALQRVDDYEHVVYEVRRDLEARADQQGRPLTAQERALIDELTRRSNILYQTALNESIR